MNAAVFPTSEIGLPKEVNYQLPPSLDQSARAYTVHQQPNGVSSIIGATINSTTMAANTAGFQNQAFNSQQISFDVPCGQGPSVFLDCAATTLSFRLTWQCTTASSATNGIVKLIGSGSSFFDQLQVYCNNTPIETVNQYGQLSNMAINSLVSYADRFGGLSFAGCDTDSANGIDLAQTVTTQYYTFTVPLISIIGQNTEKFLPVGLLNNLQLYLTTSAMLPVTSFATAVTTVPVFAPPILDQFVLNMKYVDLGPSAGQAIMSSLRDSKLFIKSATYTNSNVTIPTGSSGLVSSLLQIRNSSVKSLFFYNSFDKGATAVNGNFEGINPASTQCQAVVGGSRYPNRQMNPSVRPSEALCYYLEAWGAKGSWKSFGSVINRNYYGRTLPSAPAGSDNSIVVPASGAAAAPVGASETGVSTYLINYPSMHYLGIDFEKAPALLSGVNTRNTPPYVEQNLAVASGATISLLAWGLSDVILEIDAVSKQIVAYI